MELIIKSFFMFQKIKSSFTFLYVMKIFCIFIILFSSNEIEKPSFKVSSIKTILQVSYNFKI